jgi:hypothetical protein
VSGGGPDGLEETVSEAENAAGSHQHRAVKLASGTRGWQGGGRARHPPSQAGRRTGGQSVQPPLRAGAWGYGCRVSAISFVWWLGGEPQETTSICVHLRESVAQLRRCASQSPADRRTGGRADWRTIFSTDHPT